MKQRLDQALVERGLCESREKARRAIMAGQVIVNDQPARKPAEPVKPEDRVTLTAAEKYVSRGGHKLEHALQHFQLDVTGQTAIDLGASTGGFTDCLLQHGAAKIYAVDVGHGQLAWKLRNDPRVVVMEKTNARDLTPARFTVPFVPMDGAVIDCSFISLTRILPVAIALLRASGRIVALIKPQFEAGKAEADKGQGVITDPAIHARVLDEIETFVRAQPQLSWRGVTESPLLGPAGNKEFLALIEKTLKSIKRVGLIGNSEKVSARAVVNEAARLITRAGCKVYTDAATAAVAGIQSNVLPNTAALSKHVDLLLVFGGDGTMLRVASEVAGSPTPLLGINIGGLGFLTAISTAEMATALKRVLRGEYSLESRALIEVTGSCNGRDVRQCALNDFVISRGIVSRLITLEVSVNDELLTRYRCDGLIVSSPTGSTAYSLSAGGAIVHPLAEVFELTPICPHTLSNRSVIVSLDSRIQVKVVSPRPETILSADSQGICGMATGESVTIQRSRDSIRLVRLIGSSFFDTLGRKLHWSGTNV